ncbi:hypothetical protein C8R44DRAFT_815209 [Mycena epipterygia]|nr:hypothetical protein C8R44DRAFT_815209 [Mycena epipterygia]
MGRVCNDGSRKNRDARPEIRPSVTLVSYGNFLDGTVIPSELKTLRPDDSRPLPGKKSK